MIFKTFDTNVDKMSAKWGMFGKSFNEIGQAISGRVGDINKSLKETNNLFSSLNNSPSVLQRLFPSKESIKSQLIDVGKLYPEIDFKNFDFNKWINELNDIDKKVKAGTMSWQDYSNKLEDNNKWIAKWGQETEGQIRTQQQMIEGNERLRKSALDHNAALQKQTLGAKAAAAGMKLLTTALNAVAYYAIAQAITAIISRFNELVNAYQNGIDKLNDLSNEISSLESEIKGLESELSKTKLKIDELEKLPKLTFLQKEELEELRRFNDKLERQRKIREAQIEYDKSQQNKEAQFLWGSMKSFINYEVKPVDEWEWYDYLGSFGTRNAPLERIANLFQKNLFSDQLADLEAYEKKLKEINDIKESADYKNGSKELDEEITSKENELASLKSNILDYYGKWNKVIGGLNADDPKNAEAIKELGAAIDRWDILSGKVENTFKGIYNSSNFATVKKSLDDLAAKGELTVEKFNSLTENEVTGIDRFREALKNVKDLTVEDVIESINQEIKDSAKEADNTSNSIKNLSEAFDKLYDSIDDVLSKQEKLAEAFKKTRLGAKLTIQELYDLIKEMPSLAKYASKDGDGYTISAEGFEKVSKENDNAIKEQLTKDLENVRNQLSLLDQEEELLTEKERLAHQLASTNGQNNILISQLEEVTEKYEDVANQCQYITDSAEDLAEAEKGLVILNDLVGASFDETKLAIEGVNEAYNNAKTEISGYNSNIQTIDNAIKTLNDGLLLTYDEMNALVEISPKLQDSFEEQENGYSIVIEALENLREESYKTRNAYIDDLIAQTQAEIDAAETSKETYENRIKTINGLSEGVVAANAAYISYLEDNIDDIDEKLQAWYDTINKLEGLRGNITSDSGDDDLSDKLQNQIDQYKTILSAVDAVKNKYSEAIDKEIDALEDGKKALRDSNDERQRELDLIEARNNLENAKKRKVWVYSEGEGFKQVTDEKAVKEAEEDYRNVIVDIQEAEIDKRIEALEDQKEQLEENTKALTELESEIEDAKNIAQAVKALGLNDESELLNLPDDTVEEIRNGFAEATLQKDIEDNKNNDKYTPVSMDEFLQSLGAKVNAVEAAQILVGNNKSVYDAAVQSFKDALDGYANSAASSIVNNGGTNVTNYNTFEIYDATDPDKVARIVNQEITDLFTKIGNSIK